MASGKFVGRWSQVTQHHQPLAGWLHHLLAASGSPCSFPAAPPRRESGVNDGDQAHSDFCVDKRLTTSLSGGGVTYRTGKRQQLLTSLPSPASSLAPTATAIHCCASRAAPFAHVKPPTPEGVGFPGIVRKPLCEARAGLACYNILGLAVPDQDFRAMRSDAKDVRIGRPACTVEILDTARSDRSRTRPAHSQGLAHQGKLAHGLTWGAAATANHDFKQQDDCIYPEAVIVPTSALNPPA
jgi:hypothetical protein